MQVTQLPTSSLRQPTSKSCYKPTLNSVFLALELQTEPDEDASRHASYRTLEASIINPSQASALFPSEDSQTL